MGSDRYEAARERMVERQLRGRGIRDESVLDAMRSVPRHEFVPRALHDRAYHDRPLGIGEGQTISQPYMVAYTIEAARVGSGDVVLDVGTGSGYAAAVLGRIVRSVHSVERVEALAEAAAERLQRLGFDNVHVHLGDGSLGWPGHAPYDAIAAAAAGPAIPAPWLEQLAPGGRIVAPVDMGFDQRLVRLTHGSSGYRREELLSVRYVPLIGDAGY